MRSWHIVATVSRADGSIVPYTLSFDRQPITIGASVDNDIVLESQEVSSNHAHVTMSRGALSVHDHSRNGTFVGNTAVDRRILAPADIVHIPPYQLQFELHLAELDEFGTAVTPLPQEGTIVLSSKTPRKALFLEVLAGPAPAVRKHFALPPDGIRIGRSPTADLTLDVPTLSRMHAEIRYEPDGEWHLLDRGSANGSFLNGVRVENQRIRPGDEITLAGEVTLRVVDGVVEAGGGSTPTRRAAESRRTGESPIPTPPLPSGQPSMPRRMTNTGPGPNPASTVPAESHNETTSRRSALPTISPRTLGVRSRRAEWNKQVLIVEIEGRVDGYNYTELGLAFDRIVDNGERTVLVDGEKLTYIDHTGLGVLMKAVTAVERYGGRLWIIGANRRLLDSISLSHLDAFLKGKVFPGERDAQQELARVRP